MKKKVKGKEYNDDNLIFEGEYLNGKRNGKGSEFNQDKKLIFEGEYFDNGEIIFEGEYLSERRWNGKIKEFSKHIIYGYRGYGLYICGFEESFKIIK